MIGEKHLNLNAEDRRILGDVQSTCRDLMGKLDELDDYVASLHHEVTLATNRRIDVTSPVAEPSDSASSDALVSHAEQLTDAVTGLRSTAARLESRIVSVELAATTAENLAAITKRATRNTAIALCFSFIVLVTVATLAVLNRVTADRLTTLVDQSRAQQAQLDTQQDAEGVIRKQALCKLYSLFLGPDSMVSRTTYPGGPLAYDHRTASLQAQQKALKCTT